MEPSDETSNQVIVLNTRIADTFSSESTLTTIDDVNDIQSKLGSITEYADEPLLPLVKACAPLTKILQNLSFYVELALNETMEQPPDGLTIDESAAVRLYTIQWEGNQRSLYTMLNYALKNDTRENLRPYFKYLKLFLTALVKLTCVPSLTVWRGVTKDLSTQFPLGTLVVWWSFSSCTTSLVVLESNMYLGNTGKRTLFSVEAINGRSIKAHSHFVTEDEILLLPGTQMVVKSQFSPAPDLHIIHLKQIIPKETLLKPPFKNAHLYPKIKRQWYRKKKIIIPICILIAACISMITLVSVLVTRPTEAPTCLQPFVTSTVYNISGNPVAGSLGKFRNKISLDLVVVDHLYNNISILFNDGKGAFSTSRKIGYAIGISPSSVVSANFNNDSHLDLAIVYSGDNKISVLLGNGNGDFRNQCDYTVGDYPLSLISADFNKDKIQDLAVTNLFDDTISVLLGSANGTFQTPGNYPTGAQPYCLIAEDLNGDMILDLAVTNRNNNTVNVMFGNSNGIFQGSTFYSVGNGPSSITLNDFNGDKKMDLVVTNYAAQTISILYNKGDGTFHNQITFPSGFGGSTFTISGDFNKDNKADLVMSNSGGDTVVMLLGYGNGTFRSPIVFTIGAWPSSLIAGDVNNDDKTDLVVVDTDSGDISVFLNMCN